MMHSSPASFEMQSLPTGPLHPLSLYSSRLFIALIQNPAVVGCLGRLEARGDVDVCKRVIVEIIFPPSQSHLQTRPRPFSVCLSSLFATEISACTDLKRLLRENSLACIVGSSYCKSSVPRDFLAATLKPIFDLALQHPSLQGPSQGNVTGLFVSVLRRVIEEIRGSINSSTDSSRVTIPDTIIASSLAIAAALKAHPLHNPPQTPSVESAVASFVFLRFIVPFVVSFGVGRPQPQQKFFVDLGTVLQKLCSHSSFGPGHNLEFLNGEMGSLFAGVQEILRELAVCDDHGTDFSHSSVDTGASDVFEVDGDSHITVRDLFVFASALASCLPKLQPCSEVESHLLELISHPTFLALKTSEMGNGGIKLALNQRSLSKMISDSGTASNSSSSSSSSSSKHVRDMTNDDLILRLRTLQTANEIKLQGAGQPEVAVTTAAAASAAAPKLPRAALVSQCLQFFWMGFAWPSMGAVLPRIREMFGLNYAEGTLVFGVFACGLMLGCCFAFDEGRAAVMRLFVCVTDRFRKVKKVGMHVEFQDEDETAAVEEMVGLNQQQQQQEQHQQQRRHSFFQRLARDSDKMKLVVSLTLSVIAQLLMGTIVRHAPYTFCLGVWFIMGLANTGLNIFSGIVVSRLAPVQTTAIFACQGPAYGIAAMLASPLAAAIMTRMDNDFSWFYLLQAALGSFCVAAVALADFPFEVDNAPTISTGSSKNSSSTSSHLALLFKDRRFAFVMLSSFFYWGLDGVLSQWITSVLLDEGNTISFSSQVLSLLWAGVLVGRGILAIASISIYRGTPLRNSVLMLACVPLALVLAAVIAFTSPPAASLLATVFFYGFFLSPMDALLRGLTGALFKHPDTGQTNTPFTILFFACNGSLLVFTPLAGVFIQATGSGRAGLSVGVACGFCVLCMASCLRWRLT
jgi:fucose permease